MPQTMEDYLSEVGGLDDGGSNAELDTNTQVQDTPNDDIDTRSNEQTNNAPTAQDQPRGNEAQPRQSEQDRNAPNKAQGQQSNETRQVSERLSSHRSGKFVNQKGDIVEQDGRVIAYAGSQRRSYEQQYNLQTSNSQLSQRNQELEQELRGRAFLNDVPRQYGLSNEDVAQGLEYARRIKSGDILGIAREFVALAASKGVNISQIVGEKAGDAIDMQAIRAMLDERFAPIAQATSQSQQEAEREGRARNAYNNFVSDNEYADVHGDLIVATMQRTGSTLQAAYNTVRTFAAQNGLDFSRPLGPQIEELANGQQQQQQQQTRQQQRPLPNGANVTSASNVQSPAPMMADPDDSWASIIRNAQAQAKSYN